MKREKLSAAILISLAAVMVATGGVWMYYQLRYPYYRVYRREMSLSFAEAWKYLGKPSSEREINMAMSVLSEYRRWNELDKYTSKDRKSVIGTYYYNLSNAKRGLLADRLMDYYQPFDIGLFLPVNENSSKFAIVSAGDVWFELGDMTMAEHSAILSMAFSPKHKGSRFYRRMAEINLVNGDDKAAAKYLMELSRHPSTRQWAEDHTPGRQTESVQRLIGTRRSLKPKSDTLHMASDVRASLHNLLNGNPGNSMAREYLLCYDLLIKDIDSFYKDYDPTLSHSRLYDEAILIYLASHDLINNENVDLYGITQDVGQDFSDFSRIYAENNGDGHALTARFGKTYWYFYRYAVRNEKK